METIIIAGGAGFIGSHLTDAYLNAGYRVTVVDNLYTGSMSNIQHHIDNPHFTFIKADISNMAINKAMEVYDTGLLHPIKAVFNLACPASPVAYQADPIQTLKTCFNGTLELLHIAHSAGCKFIQASTSEVYGDPLVSPQSEDYKGNVSCNGIRACYDEGKRVAETLISEYQRKYNVDTKIARIFNTYGPRMQIDDGRVVSNFIVQALTNHPLTIYGTGSQTRSFCYVSDLVKGLMQLADSSEQFHGPVNLGNDNEFTMLELAELIGDILGTNVQLVFKDLPADDPKVRRPNLSLAKERLQYSYNVLLREGIKETIEYFKGVVSTNA